MALSMGSVSHSATTATRVPPSITSRAPALAMRSMLDLARPATSNHGSTSVQVARKLAPTAPATGANVARCSAEGTECSVVVRLVSDLANQFVVHNIAGLVDDDDGAGAQAFERAVGHTDAVVAQEVGVLEG